MTHVIALLVCCLLIFLVFRFAETNTADYDYPTGSLSCKLYRTSSLDCSLRDLTSIPPLPANITTVDLSNNMLMNLSDTVFNGQTFLAYVDLQHNWLQMIRGFPFTSLERLEILDLSNNYLEELDKTSFYGLHELKQLCLGSNKLHSLYKHVFTALDQLQVLDLQRNFLTDIPSEALAPLTLLRELNMLYNYFTTYTFGKGFQNLMNLSILKVHSVNLTGWGNNSLLYSKSSDSFQERLVILDNKTFENLARSPVKRLQFYYRILDNVTVITDKDLFLPFRNLSDLGTFSKLVNVIPSAGSTLKYLNFYMNTSDMKLDVTSLDFALQSATSLEHLDLSYSFINGIYGPAFANFSFLRKLQLNGVIYSMQYISDDAFAGLQNLEELYLAYNQINKLPVGAFKSFENGTLRLLDLSYNSLTGVFPDKYSFSAVSSLTHLNLSCNPIITVGEWIHVLTNLREFKLNSMTAALYIDFSDWIKPLLHLKRLDMSFPDFKDLMKSENPQISKQAPGLRTLTLAGMHIFSLHAAIGGLENLETLIASESFVVLKNFGKLWGQDIHLIFIESVKLGSKSYYFY